MSNLQYLPELDRLPLVIAGPILRHTQAGEVTVWLALRKSDTVTLKVYDTKGGTGAVLDSVIFEGRRSTIAFGDNLHIVAVTALPIGNRKLVSNRVYAYDFYCHEERQNLLEAIDTQQHSISYFSHQLPTFALPPSDLNSLKIVHGSCRKPHGGGRDALAYLDDLIQNAASSAEGRPQQVFLTGDQIYGDDVADPMLWACQGIEGQLLGWWEELPLQNGVISSQELPAGRRTELARIEGGLTAMLENKEDKAKSHLFSFGEYAAAYLLAWSPVLAPSNIPDSDRLGLKQTLAKVWDKERSCVRDFFQSLSKVRRALANVAVYTICDDHDVSDDWYLNREWCDRVLGKPLGKRVVQNGLLTYAIFQAWGNTPERFQPGTNGAKLLDLASKWLRARGRDETAKALCDRYLGIPTNSTANGAPRYQSDEDVIVLEREPEAIPWNYTVLGASHEVIVLDTRTWRGYPAPTERRLEPPMLLSPLAFDRQLKQPLKDTPDRIGATFVILPTNLVALGIIDRIQQYELSRNRVFNTDVGDSWNFHETAFATLLLNLCHRRERVIILSGDIHYSCAVRLVHWDRHTDETSTIVQLTSSAIANSELATRIVHTKLKSLLPERTKRFIGWNYPLKQVELSRFSWWNRKKNQYPTSDWQYRIEWVRRQPAKPMFGKTLNTDKTKGKVSFWQRLLDFLLLLLWRNRWLQEGWEVVGRNNISLVKLRWTNEKIAIQETYWQPPWTNGIVKSCYKVLLDDWVRIPIVKDFSDRV